jgi:GAF domain-containing protein
VHPILAAARAFTQSLEDLGDLDQLLHELVTRATASLRAVGAGVMLEDSEGRLSFAAASGPIVEAVEQHQDDLQEGPCASAFGSGAAVVVHDLAGIPRWPRYRVRAHALGLRAVIGIPMTAHGRTIGVLNVYRSEAVPWTSEDVEACELFADMAAAYLLHAGEIAASRRLNDNLRQALASRGLIERAKGILMHRDGVDAEAAFDLLRRRSMASHRKLRDVAADVVAELEEARAAGEPELVPTGEPGG